MANYNRIIMMGNLTRDPELKQISSGQSVCRFGLASNRQFKNKQSGTMVQEVCFVDVDVWGSQADVCKQYLAKGRSVLIEGRLKLDSWQDPEGNKRSKHSIVADRVTFLGAGASAEDEVGGDEYTPAKSEEPVKRAASKSAPSLSTGEVVMKDDAPFEDELPF